MTDISTGRPIPGADITIAKNTTKTHEDTWNSTTQKNDRKIYPLTKESYGTGYVLGRTDIQGVLSIDIEKSLQDDLYNASYLDWWDGGTYSSYIIKSTKSNIS